MKIKKIIGFFFLFFSTCCFALEDNSPLKLTLVNQSNETFIFKGVSGQNPTNTFSVNPLVIYPGTAAVVIGKTSRDYDLAAELNFKDSEGHNAFFTIVDYRQFHTGQPIFSLSSQKTHSVVKSRTANPVIDPKALMYTGAEVVIYNNN